MQIHRTSRVRSGFALVEALAALVILALIITTSLLVFIDRQKRLLLASDTVIAAQTLANEAELQRRRDFSSYVPDEPSEFLTFQRQTPFDAFHTLPDVKGEVLATTVTPGVLAVRMRLTWGTKSSRSSELTILRTGARLW